MFVGLSHSLRTLSYPLHHRQYHCGLVLRIVSVGHPANPQPRQARQFLERGVGHHNAIDHGSSTATIASSSPGDMTTITSTISYYHAVNTTTTTTVSVTHYLQCDDNCFYYYRDSAHLRQLALALLRPVPVLQSPVVS